MNHWNTGPVTSRTQQTETRRWLLPFLAALVATLAAILFGTAASASASGGAENRVGAIGFVAEFLVEPPQGETPGQRLGEAALRAGKVVATGVAAKSGDGLIDPSKVRFTQDSAGSSFSDGG